MQIVLIILITIIPNFRLEVEVVIILHKKKKSKIFRNPKIIFILLVNQITFLNSQASQTTFNEHQVPQIFFIPLHQTILIDLQPQPQIILIKLFII
jgi:hypothetical protein